MAAKTTTTTDSTGEYYLNAPYHDITISLSSTDILKEVISFVTTLKPSWEDKSLKTTLFTDGISNKLIGCFHGDRISNETGVLVRVNGLGTEKIIDRENEIKTFNLLSGVKCMNSASLIAVFANGLCYQYLDGVTLDENTVRDPYIAKLIAMQMARMHYLCKTIPPPTTASYGSTIAKFLANIPKSFDDPSKQKAFEQFPDISMIEGEIKSVVSAIEKLKLPLVMSHNDLLLANILYDKSNDKVKFIDYEYSGFNYNCYDIGNHFAEYAGLNEVDYSRYPDKQYQIQWLTYYLEQAYSLEGKDPISITEYELNTLYIGANLSALAAHLYWGLWSLYQASSSAIAFDFIGYGKKRIDEFLAKKQEFYALIN